MAEERKARDQLNFTPHVMAVRDFLLHPATKPPLALSVEGDWGSGKSYFMQLLRDALKKEGHKTVWFNAWRHDQAESLWAAFALQVTRALRRQCGLLRGVWGKLWLLALRYDWLLGLPPLLWATVVLLVCVAVVAAGVLVATGQVPLPDDKYAYWSTAAGAVAAAIAAAVKLKELLGDTLRVDLGRYVRVPDYTSHICFVERFHEDFCRIVRAYAGDSRVFVFIDDLDRCEVPKAADLLQALNLLLPQEGDRDEGNLVYILGMDRTAVAAGLAVKYERIVPFVMGQDREGTGARAEGEREADPAERQRAAALEFGGRFIRKFVQLPFRIPSATTDSLSAWLGRGVQTGEATPPPVHDSWQGFLDHPVVAEEGE